MNLKGLSRADRVALIALAGIVASLGVWIAYSLIEAVMLTGRSASDSVLVPAPDQLWGRLLAIVGVLVATLLIQILYARHLDVTTELALERARVREMYDNSPDRIACLDASGAVSYTNVTDSDATPPADDHEPIPPCYQLLYRRDTTCAGCQLPLVAEGGGVAEFTESEAAADGTERWFNKLMYPITNADGEIDSVVEVARDVTDLHAAEVALVESHHQLEARIADRTAELTESNLHLLGEIAARERVAEALRESEGRLRQLIEASPDMIILHSEGHIDLVNAAGVRMLGAASAADVVGSAFTALWDDGSHALAASRVPEPPGSSVQKPALKLRRLDGSALEVEMTETLVVLDGRIHVQCLIRDISEAVTARETINRMAYYDALTELPNRALFIDRVEQAIANVRRNRLVLAVAFVDIDDFRKVNERLGHAVGDAALRQFAERLQSLFRENDTVSRYGSDEFAVLAELKTPSEAVRFAERLQAGLRPALRVDGNILEVSVSIGIAMTRGRGITVEDLLRRADAELCRSKASGNAKVEIAAIDSDEGHLRAQA